MSAELNSRYLGSQCEVVIVVLQGLMSSQGGTSAGGVTGGVTGSELAKICQQSHMSVMGRNKSGVYSKGNTGMLCQNMEQEQGLGLGLNLRW